MADTVGGQIISELGNIAKDVGKQTAQIPKDIAGKALESLGAAAGKNPKGKTVVSQATASGDKPSVWEQIDKEPDRVVKRHIARAALEELTRGSMRKKEPSIWERLQQENEQKKEMQKQQAAAAAQSLPTATSKRPRGDLYGAKAKQTATENRNVRQD